MSYLRALVIEVSVVSWVSVRRKLTQQQFKSPSVVPITLVCVISRSIGKGRFFREGSEASEAKNFFVHYMTCFVLFRECVFSCNGVAVGLTYSVGAV